MLCLDKLLRVHSTDFTPLSPNNPDKFGVCHSKGYSTYY